jgi:ketosteroid isomerase-like protein
MSQENVEFLRTWAAAWKARPEGGPLVNPHTGEAVTSHLDPQVVYEDAALPDHARETYYGIEGVVRATERWVEPSEELTVDLERIVGTGDCLVSIHSFRARARYTGIEFDEPLAILWRFRDGRVIYFRSFRDIDEALEAAGRGSRRCRGRTWSCPAKPLTL